MLGASLAQAAEFKPFVTVQIAGHGTLISIAERVAAVAEVPALSEQVAMAALYRNVPGVNAAGNIGLAIATNEDSPFGVDAVISLPVSNFGLTGWEALIRQFGGQFGVEVTRAGNRFTFATPAGNFIAYQRQGFFLVATEGAAEFAATADHRTLFAEVADFTLGAHFNLENITEEAIEMILGQIAFALAMQGMDFLNVEVLDELVENLEAMASVTMGMTIDPRTLNISGTIRTVANAGTELAGKYARLRDALANSKMGAFLPDTPQTVFSWHFLDYMTDTELEMAREVWDGIADGLMEGLQDAMEDEINEEQLGKLVEAIEVFLEYIDDVVDFIERERLIDSTLWLDSEGTFITATATSRTAEAVALDEGFYGRLSEIFGLETFIEGKIRRNYATVAGFSLSAVPNIFVDLPADVDLPEGAREVLADVPLSLFWAVKEGEALVYAFGFDFDKTEATVKAALARTATPTAPTQAAVFAFGPFAELFLNRIYPLLTLILGEDAQVRAAFEAFGRTAPNDKIVYLETYPDASSHLQTFQVSGELVTVFIKLMAEASKAAGAW